MSWYDSRAYYQPENYAEEQINQVEKCYDLSRIDKDISYAIDFLKHLEKAQKACQSFLSVAYYHKGHVEETKFRYEVYYKRYSSFRGKVDYYTGVYVIPCIPGGEKCKNSIENKRWSGKERHLAKKVAIELAEKYKCKIINY